MKKVTIVMATYNGSAYIDEQMQSFLEQSYPLSEVLIFDDGSSDDTVEKVEKFIGEHNLNDIWKIVRNEKNLGYADNFRQGIVAATGDYIFFSDQDDIWLETKVEEMIAQMEADNNIKLLCCTFDVLKSSEDAPAIANDVLDKMKNDKSLEFIPLNHKNIFINSLGCLMCITKEFRDEIEQYWFSGWAHDEYVWKLAQCFDGCYIYHSKLVKRRLHSNNVSMRKYHVIDKRVIFLENLLRSHNATLSCATDMRMKSKELSVINKNVISTNYRIKMLKKRNVLYAIPLLAYTSYYHSKKSILMEPYLVVRSLVKRGV